MSITVERNQSRTAPSRLSVFVRTHPAQSFVVLAMILAMVPLGAIAAGLLPSGASQLVAFSASAAAVILAAVEGRKGGVRELLGRVLIWRVGIGWWIFALFFPVLPSVVTLYVYHFLGGPEVDWSGLQPLYSVIPMIVMLTVLAGIGEEFGWRGFVLPRLQARHSALVSSLIIGLIWGTWHIPLFFTKGQVQYEWRMEAGPIIPIVGYALYLMAASIQFTWLFNNTKGSVLLAAVKHGAENAWIGGYIDVYRGHFEGILVFLLVSTVFSALILLLSGPTHLSRNHQRNVVNASVE